VADVSALPPGNILLTTAERMIYSAHNYWLVLVSDVAGAVGFLIFGIRHLSGSATAAGVSVIVGFLAWSFLEYVLHRWVLHGRPSMARRGHARHHADDTALISTPALVVMAAACAMWAILSLVFPADVACLLVFGLYAGYNHYALLHHLQHRRGRAFACLAGLERVHRLHHNQHTVNYGVTSTLWDRLLGTFQPPHDAGKNRSVEAVVCSPVATSCCSDRGRSGGDRHI
jgi:sterol desaturase/sphingolipid hydroxylase (fatty acid hydroxylase superfamily)